NNQFVCVPSILHGTPVCSPPTVSGGTKTGADGSFAARNLSADTYTVCVDPPAPFPLPPSCEWPAPGSASPTFKLTENEDRTRLQIVLRSGSLVVITVKDPMSATATSFFLPGVIVG